MKRQSYLAQLVALEAGGVLRRGEVHLAKVVHDPRCPKPWGGKECTCPAPEVLVDGKRVTPGVA